MRILETIFIIFLFVNHANAFEAVAVISGIAKTKDGDGILFGKVEVRLQGIAAPEDNSRKVETGGPESTANLRKLVDGNYAICHLDGSLAGKRPVGICFVNAREINLHQVKTGHARDCPAFSMGRYKNAEQEAQEAGIDLSQLYVLPNYCH